MSFIEFKNVSYKYPLSKNYAIKDFSYSFEKGKFYGIIGQNGGGKTTLCNMIRGLIPHFYQGEISGEVLIDGVDVRKADIDALSVKIGYIFQNPFTQISGVKETVFEEIAMGLENLGVPKEEMIQRVVDVIKLLKIEDLMKNNPNKLSGGQRQKVAFASIIVMESDVLVIDEPTSQLDPVGTADIFDIIHMLKEKGKTIILVEHKSELIAEYADQVLVLNEGQLIKSGSAEEVFSDREITKKGAIIPPVALLGLELRDQGYHLDYIPITRTQAKEQILKNGVV